MLTLYLSYQALALLADYIDKEESSIRIGAIMGLGLAYAGSQNEQVKFLYSYIGIFESLFIAYCNLKSHTFLYTSVILTV